MCLLFFPCMRLWFTCDNCGFLFRVSGFWLTETKNPTRNQKQGTQNLLSLLYKGFVLFILFAGGYLLMRYGMEIENQTAFWVAGVGMPLATFLLWLAGYRGRRFK